MNEKIVNIINEEPFVGEDGFDYIKVTKEILTPRKTYLKGTLSGKYRGNKIPDDSDKSSLFDFEIYEAEVNCNSVEDFSKNKPFSFPHDFKNITNAKKIKVSVFPKEKLPQILPVIISANNKTFGINVLEPQLYEFTINRKEHQIDGNEVFGTFNAYITGYVFDYERDEVEEINKVVLIDVIDVDDNEDGEEDGRIKKPCKSNGIKTGEFEEKECYKRYEYFCKHHPDTVWGPWEKIPCGTSTEKGCLSIFGYLFSIVLIVFFIYYAFPVIGIIILIYCITYLINRFSSVFRWMFGILGIIFWLFFIVSIFKTCSLVHIPNIIPKPKIEDSRENVVYEPIDNDSTTISIGNDSLVKRFRKWQDYEGNIYQGYYTLKLFEIKQSSRFKNSINLTSSTPRNYDQMVYMLKGNDESKLDGLYRMFDSIRKKNKLNDIKFSEMIVSCIQDIPYTLILENECNAQLYNDKFIRDYLMQGNKCSGYQKFGINSPLEFVYTLEGDCDTRALLLFTILSHYKYDVALMSSEFYGHSMIAINLPFSGINYSNQNKKYVMWETTAPDIPAGRIGKSYMNLNYWRISLKSN